MVKKNKNRHTLVLDTEYPEGYKCPTCKYRFRSLAARQEPCYTCIFKPDYPYYEYDVILGLRRLDFFCEAS